jgi:hypothetical protein
LFNSVFNLIYNHSVSVFIKFWSLFDHLLKLEFALYLRTFIIALALDTLILDDEPLWEPLEWSVMQTWILFLYVFSWTAEVLFSSRYGSYTNRDKIVWIGLFKVYYMILAWFILNVFIVTIFVTLPFYFEVTYAISYSVLWWNWLTSAFFYKLTVLFSTILILALLIRFQIRWSSHYLTVPFLTIIVFIIAYTLYFLSMTVLFGFFTDSLDFRDSGWSDYSKIIHGPKKWGWGLEGRDHFSYHKTPENLWFKNDPLIASSLLFLNIFFLFYFFFLFLQVLSILRTVVASGELSFNQTTFFYGTLKYFYYLLLLISFLVVMSLFYQFLRFPFELGWFGKAIYLSRSEWLVIYDFITLFLP